MTTRKLLNRKIPNDLIEIVFDYMYTNKRYNILDQIRFKQFGEFGLSKNVNHVYGQMDSHFDILRLQSVGIMSISKRIKHAIIIKYAKYDKKDKRFYNYGRDWRYWIRKIPIKDGQKFVSDYLKFLSSLSGDNYVTDKGLKVKLY